MTAIAGSVLTAAQMNTFVRDNLIETMPAKAVLPGSYFVTTGWGEVAARFAAGSNDDNQVTVTATSFDNPESGPPGPSVTAVTGPMALVGYKCQFQIASATTRIEMGYEVSGDTSIEASLVNSLGYSKAGTTALWWRMGAVDLATDLTPGTNTFTLKYNVAAGSGMVVYRHLWVLPL